jgi:hypothetical protein
VKTTSSEDLVREAAEHRAAIGRSLEALSAVYEALDRRARRPDPTPPPGPEGARLHAIEQDTARAYLHVAQAGRRFVGMVLQALKRSEVFDRNVATTRQASEDAWKQKEEGEAKRVAQLNRQALVKKAAEANHARWYGHLSTREGGPVDDVYALYGEG